MPDQKQNAKHTHWCSTCGSLVVADRCSKPDAEIQCLECSELTYHFGEK